MTSSITEQVLAAKVRQDLGITLTLPIFNLFNLLRSQGKHVIRYPFGFKGDTSALLAQMENIQYIAVDSTKNLGRQIFSTAHELGHMYMHSDRLYFICSPDENSLCVNRSDERFADRFAACFLMPQLAIEVWATNNEVNLGNLGPHEVLRLQHAFQVSYAMTLNRLQALGMITPEAKVSWNSLSPITLAKRWGMPTRLYEADSAIEVPEDYLAKWVDSYEAGRVSLARLRNALERIGVDIETLALQHPTEAGDVI